MRMLRLDRRLADRDILTLQTAHHLQPRPLPALAAPREPPLPRLRPRDLRPPAHYPRTLPPGVAPAAHVAPPPPRAAPRAALAARPRPPPLLPPPARTPRSRWATARAWAGRVKSCYFFFK